MFGKPMFVTPGRDNGTERGINQRPSELQLTPLTQMLQQLSSCPRPPSKFLGEKKGEARSSCWVFWTLIVSGSKPLTCQSSTFGRGSFGSAAGGSHTWCGTDKPKCGHQRKHIPARDTSSQATCAWCPSPACSAHGCPCPRPRPAPSSGLLCPQSEAAPLTLEAVPV